ncbi:hypothetical protein L1987_80861 [Smallanthus sonchifolius]|uniref:Uncharacterized protein n=1 Tax=Smallanthus sonchifolius TaxID=185202 RepID=A0ACB8YPX7_9ASTR|nr:hypothetical protein L1987_80861 [Smallanthus sonchifolius]
MFPSSVSAPFLHLLPLRSQAHQNPPWPLKTDREVPIDCFEEPSVLFRGKDGKPGCVKSTCAHRACPLDLGSVNEGRVQCPYHGELSMLHGKWYFIYGHQSVKFDRKNENALVSGRVTGIDPTEQIMTRCIRIFKLLENNDHVSCVLCRAKFILGFSLFMGLSVPQHFNNYVVTTGKGPVHSRSTWLLACFWIGVSVTTTKMLEKMVEDIGGESLSTLKEMLDMQNSIHFLMVFLSIFHLFNGLYFVKIVLS